LTNWALRERLSKMNDSDTKKMVREVTNERRKIRKHIDNFMMKLGLYAKYTVRFTKYEAWSIRFKEFSGSIGQGLLLQAHLALKLSEDKIHNAVVHWVIPEDE